MAFPLVFDRLGGPGEVIFERQTFPPENFTEVSCSVQTASVTVAFQQTATLSIECVGEPPLTYQWTPSNLIASGQGTPSVTTVPLTQSTTFQVSVKNGQWTASYDVTVQPEVQVGSCAISVAPPILQPGETATLTAVCQNFQSDIYHWEPAEFIASGQDSFQIVTVPLFEDIVFTLFVGPISEFSYRVSAGVNVFTEDEEPVLLPPPAHRRMQRGFVDLTSDAVMTYFAIADSVRCDRKQLFFQRTPLFVQVYRKGKETATALARYDAWARDEYGRVGFYWDSSIAAPGWYVLDFYIDGVYCFSSSLRTRRCEATIVSSETIVRPADDGEGCAPAGLEGPCPLPAGVPVFSPLHAPRVLQKVVVENIPCKAPSDEGVVGNETVGLNDIGVQQFTGEP